jgi:AraC-like DNA-binding protein
MTLQEKFDDIIGCIEYLVENGEEDIPQALSKETGFNLRLLGDSFQFITDMTLAKYIRQRRLIHALTNKVQKNLSVEDIAAETTFCDAAAFTKACKNEFNLTPGQITEEVLQKFPPLRFAIITSGSAASQMENDKLTTTEITAGVSSEQFAEIKRVLEISAVYGFDDDDAEFVYRMATEFNISIEEAAEFCEEARIQEQFDLTDHEVQQLLYEIRNNGYAHLYELPKGFFDVYFSEENDRHGWFVPYICEIAEALNEHGMCSDDLDQIALHADTYGVDIVEAIENFDEYEKSWDDAISDVLTHGIPEDDTAGFGYRSIWEFDEEDPNQYDCDTQDEDS